MKKQLLFLGIVATMLSCEKSELAELTTNSETATVAQMRSTAAETDAPFSSFKPSPDYVMLFTDRFTSNNIGTAGNGWWSAREGQIQSTVGPICYNHAANLTVANGILDINYIEDSLGYLSGGGIYSNKTFGYGYYEARVKLYTGCYGFHQSFWSNSTTQDVDGFEFDSRTTGNSYLYPNRHWYVEPKPYIEAPRNFLITNKTCYQPIDNSTSNWMTLGYEWLPDSIVFYANGLRYGSIKRTTRDASHPDVDLFTVYSPCKMVLTGAPYAIYKTVDMGKPLTGAKMQIENVAYSAKKLPGVNLLGNEGFEYFGPTALNGISQGVTDWYDYQLRNPTTNVIVQAGTNTNSYVKNVGIDAHSGSSILVQTGSAIVSQKLNFIPNGTYKLSAWIKCSAHSDSDGFKFMILGKDNQTYLLNSSGADCIRKITYGHNTWTYIEISDIVVNDNFANIAISSNAAAGEWSQVDDIKFSVLP